MLMKENVKMKLSKCWKCGGSICSPKPIVQKATYMADNRSESDHGEFSYAFENLFKPEKQVTVIT